MLKRRYFAYCGGIYSVCQQYWDKHSAFFKLSAVYLQQCDQRSLSKAFKIVFTFLSVLVILKNGNLWFYSKLEYVLRQALENFLMPTTYVCIV